MKKYDSILKLSFIPYVFALYASSYVTAQTWADVIFLIFLISILYQIWYLLFLRKKENMGFFRSLGKIFLYFTVCVEISIFIDYIDMFINGYVAGGLFNFYSSDIRYYGFEAIANATKNWEGIMYIPTIIICIIYQICYAKVSRKIAKNNKK